MNSVTAQAAELKRALQQLYKQAKNADTKDDTSAKKKPNFSYTSKSEQKPKLEAKADEDSFDDDILSGSGWANMAGSSLMPGAGMGLAALGMIGGGAEGYDAAARNQKLISQLEEGGEATDDLEDYDDLTDDVPDEFKGAREEMRRFISDTNNKKGKKMNEKAMKKSAAFAASLGHYSGTMHKRAIMETLKGFGNNALDYYKGLDPTAQAAILGGGVGAGVGGIGNALFGKRKKGVGILGRLGRGALAGGGIGALGGAGINEAAIRLGMHNSRLDRAGQIHSSGFEENKMPSQMANDYIGGLANILAD